MGLGTSLIQQISARKHSKPKVSRQTPPSSQKIHSDYGWETVKAADARWDFASNEKQGTAPCELFLIRAVGRGYTSAPTNTSATSNKRLDDRKTNEAQVSHQMLLGWQKSSTPPPLQRIAPQQK